VIILADHNLEGQAVLLWGTLARQGWVELLELQLLTFVDVGLPIDSDDRTVWRFVQANHLLLLTGNRSMEGTDSLEETIRQENNTTAIPVITVADVDRLDERNYREKCASRLIEIILDLDLYFGSGRLFIP
jgi:hypothetical protein